MTFTWGDYQLEQGAAARWVLGPLTLWAFRFPHEWRLMHIQSKDALAVDAQAHVPVDDEERRELEGAIIPHAEVGRYSFHHTDPTIHLSPRLADRPVVVRPETPFYVPAGESVRLYISTPLWIRMTVKEDVLLREVPTFRPSDTWFGASTREGELCYASRSAARLELAALPQRKHRAVTPVLIDNRGSTALLIERIQVPVRYLSLYRHANGMLWTQTVTMVREADEGASQVRFNREPPREAAGAPCIQEPRDKTKADFITRTFMAFHSMF